MASVVNQSTPPEAATVHKVVKSFGGVLAVRGVSLTVRAGEVHGLVGHNGAGKTTLVKMLTGALRPDSGMVLVGGRRLEPTPASALRLGVRCLYQQRTLFPNCTVAENVAMLVRRRVSYVESRSRAIARDRLGRLGCEIDVSRLAGSLSVGEAQEVDIARALDDRCQLLLLDEPTTSLTAAEIDRLLEVIKHVRSFGVGVLFISHELDVVQRTADRITVLRDGMVAMDGVASAMSKRELVAAIVGRPSGRSQQDEVLVARDRLGRQPCEPLVTLNQLRGGRLSRCSLTINSGEVTGVTGILGSGAEEFAKILGGVVRARGGTIEIGSRQSKVRSPRQALRAGVSYICDDRDRAGVFDNMLPAQQIGLSRLALERPRFISTTQERAEALRLAAAVELTDRDAQRPIRELSGGTRQKVLLARCLSIGPSVIIAHDPTVGVDVGAREAIHNLLRRRANEGAAVIVVSSDTSEIADMADRAIVLRAGAVVLDTREFDEVHLVRACLGAEAPADIGQRDIMSRSPSGSSSYS